MYTVENNVPLPPRLLGDSRYPFRDMGVGQSTLIHDRTLYQVNAALRNYKKGGKRFTCRTVEGGVRVWRLE